MRFSRETIQAIRDRIDMVELVGSYTQLRQRGDRWWGLSPFKPEKTPSFSVKPQDGFYYCFATAKGGDMFHFIQEMEGLSFPEAVQLLAERAGVEVQQSDAAVSEEREKATLRELYERVTRSFHYFLTEDDKGRHAWRYAESRGITEQSMEAFSLGYAPDHPNWLHDFLRKKSYSREFLAESGLFSRKFPEYSLFRHRLMFPIADERGRIVAFGGRALGDGEKAKYINSPETKIFSKKRTLYGLRLAQPAMRESRRAYIAEGYLDVIAMHQAGFKNAVAPLGTAFTDEQARLLKRWVDEVILLFDADDAGVNAAFKTAVVAERTGLKCSAVAVPEGKDPADIYRQDGSDGVQALVTADRPVFEFMTDALAGTYDIQDSNSWDLLLQRLFPYITVITSDVRREAALDQISELFGVSRQAVHGDFERWRRGTQHKRVDTQSESSKPQSVGREVALMLAAAQDGELFAYLRSRLAAEWLQDRDARQLFLLMEDAFRHDEPLPRGLLDRVTDESMREVVLQKLTSGEYAAWRPKDIERAVDRIRIRVLENKQRRLESDLKRAERDEGVNPKELLQQKMAIDQELGNLKVKTHD
jgi:DNA primase